MVKVGRVILAGAAVAAIVGGVTQCGDDEPAVETQPTPTSIIYVGPDGKPIQPPPSTEPTQIDSGEVTGPKTVLGDTPGSTTTTTIEQGVYQIGLDDQNNVELGKANGTSAQAKILARRDIAFLPDGPNLDADDAIFLDGGEEATLTNGVYVVLDAKTMDELGDDSLSSQERDAAVETLKTASRIAVSSDAAGNAVIAPFTLGG